MTRFVRRDIGVARVRPAVGSVATPGAAAQLVVACVAAAIAGSTLTSVTLAQKISPDVSAQRNGFVIKMPGKKVVSRTSGLQLEIDSRWVNNYGYRPLQVRVISPKVTTAEHYVTVRMYVGIFDWWGGSMAVEQDFVMPLGSTAAETVIACPQYFLAQRCWWEVWVDGVKDKDLSVDKYVALPWTAGNAGGPNSGNLKFLILGSARGSKRTTTSGAEFFEALMLAAGDLPERWIEYTSFDVISLTAKQLKLVAQTQPAAFRAIMRWVRSGGQLWISDVGDDWDQLEEVERNLELATVAADDPLKRGWQPVSFRSRRGRPEVKTYVNLSTGENREVSDPEVVAKLERDPDWVVTRKVEQRIRDRRDRDAPADSSEWFVEQPFGLGSVRVFREMFDAARFAAFRRMMLDLSGEPPDPTALPTPVRVALRTVRTWESRHGMRPDSANVDFANLLVPGVGRAPVTEFRVLITLFVLAIGPGNYWWLKRSNRLHLLVLTVPLMAAVVTVALFGYALLSDGIRTLVRVHSLTTLDQRTGEAACWARLSYYSGLAPSGGLTMPDDVAIYPILADWNRRRRYQRDAVVQQMEWHGAASDADVEQRLSHGWLRSRTPTQYLTVRARQSPHRLALTPAGEAIKATNELGAMIQYVAVVDEAGGIFVGEDIADQATADLKPATRLEVLAKLRPMVLENEPQMPPGLADEVAELQDSQRRRSYRNPYELEYGVERLARNLPGDAVASLVGLGGRPAFEVPPRTYVAITETGPEVALGVPHATAEASFHVLLGRW